jgi:iron complex outermembrane receptor protein
VAALFTLIAVPAASAEPPRATHAPSVAPDGTGFTDLSLEELLEVELVYAASRRPQSVGEAPSMVTVIGRDEIQRQGYRTMAELLRAVPGFYVATDHNYSYLGVRGFARPGDYNGRVLVLLNGVRLNDDVFDSVLIGNDFVADLELVERVEIARGPAASLYGNNAFFAVINVVTRKGSDLGRGELAASGGRFGERRARAAWGSRSASGLDVLASASLLDADGQDLCFAEYEAEGRCARGLNGEASRRGFLTASWGGLQAQVAHSWRRKEIPTGAYATIFGDGRNRTWDALTRTSLQYSHAGKTASVTARVDHGRYRYRGHYVFADGADSLYVDDAIGRWWTLDASTTLALGPRHLLTAGAEIQWDAHMDQRARYVGSDYMLDVHADGSRWGVYAQDEVRLSEALRAQLGVRFDVTDTGVQRTSPRVGLVRSGPGGAVKLLYGAAFRAPNQYEQNYYAATPKLGVETIHTLELVAERKVARRFRVSAAAFDNRIADLISLEGEADDLSFSNSGRIRSRGVELVGDWRGSTGARARVSYAFQRTTDDAGGGTLTNSPAHVAKGNLDLPLFARRLWLGASVEHESARLTRDGASLPGFLLSSVTLRAPSLRRGLDLTLGVSNLFDTRYAQPGSEEHRQDALVQPGRAVSLEATWRFR